jgi:hypothetical protein
MTKKKVEASEYDHQCALIEWCERFKDRIPALGMIFASNNGIRVTIGVAVKMKKAGMKKGVPDLMLPIPSQGYRGFFLEMKIKGNSTTKEQVEWIGNLQYYGYKCSVFYTWWDAAREILIYLGCERYIPELIGDPAQYVKHPRHTRQDGSGEAARTKTRGSTSKPEKGAQTRME